MGSPHTGQPTGEPFRWIKPPSGGDLVTCRTCGREAMWNILVNGIVQDACDGHSLNHKRWPQGEPEPSTGQWDRDQWQEFDLDDDGTDW